MVWYRTYKRRLGLGIQFIEMRGTGVEIDCDAEQGTGKTGYRRDRPWQGRAGDGMRARVVQIRVDQGMGDGEMMG